MNFKMPIPSLRHLVLVKIVSHLWNRRNILSRIALSFDRQPDNYPLHEYSKEWKAFEAEVKMKAWGLSLPKPCKKQLLNFVSPIGVQIINWCKYHYMTGYNSRCLKIVMPRRFCWTMHGTVDYPQTARLMLKDEAVTIEQRYELACLSCLEDEARHLITFIPEDRRQKYINEMAQSGSIQWNSGALIFSISTIHILIVYFTFTLSGKVDQLSNLLYQKGLLPGASVNKYFFEVTLLKGSRVTCEFWFNKLSPEEKDQALVEFQRRAFHYTHFPNYNLMYYLSVMSREQQERMYKKCKGEQIACLLRWPMQSLFMEVAKCWWSYMEEDNSAWVLHAIVLKICYGCKDYDYSQLFWECWRLSSKDYKQFYLVNTQYAEHALRENQREFLKLILNEANSHEIEDLFDTICQVLMEEYMHRVISDSTLMECKRKAKLFSLNDPQNVEKRLRSRHLNRLVDIVIKNRIYKRMMKKVCLPTL